MDPNDLKLVLREIERAPDAMKRRVIHTIRTMVASERSGPIDALEIEVDRVPEELYHLVYYMLKDAPIPVSHSSRERRSRQLHASERASIDHDPASFSSLHWFAHVQQASGRAHLRERGITPSATTRRLLRECRESGHTVISNPPTFVGPATHFGRSVGEGLFALAPFVRGQMIMQFTGTVHKHPTGKKFMTGLRQDYVIHMRYLGREFTIDPLDPETHRRVVAPNYAAYINEPSPPLTRKGTNARHKPSGRNVLVIHYDHKRGLVRVEFADGARMDVDPEDLGTEATRSATNAPHRANCSWFDFPVPLTDLYRKTRVKDNGLRVYARTSLHACTVTLRGADEVVATFEAHTNKAYSFDMHHDRVKEIAVGDVLTLRDELMDGLCRHGVVLRVGDNEWDVHLRLNSGVAYRLPRIVYAGSIGGALDVPFPCIYACSDIRPGEELLCLYSSPIPTRGTRCRRLLGDADLRLPWNEYVTQ